MFQVRHAGAKGFGIFATRNIARGSRILTEQALLSITNQKPDVLAAARQLNANDRQSFLALSLNEAKRNILSLAVATWKSLPGLTSIRESRDILNIFYNNNFALADEHGTRAVFPTVARINHSCIPNSQGNFNANLNRFTIHSLRDIANGEEVTISYLHDEMALHEARQVSLKEGYGFDCDCRICTGGPEGERRRASHNLRSQVLEKLAAFATGSSALLKLDAKSEELVLLRALIETYETEGLAGRELASLYSAAAGLAIALGDHGQAVALGSRGLELERDAVGEDSPFYEANQLGFSQMAFTESKIRKYLSFEEDKSSLSYAPWT